jgi:ADP-dependent NAD(P)H-hydrate dehydratase / NAD(P)H-hydrate epimerase
VSTTDGSPVSSRSLYGRDPVDLPTGAEASALDRRAIESEGVPGAVLMENAGRSAALILHHLHPCGPIRVLVGPGNNGGDGLVLARTLHLGGRDVRVAVVGSRPDPDPLLHGHSIPTDVLDSDDPDQFRRSVTEFLSAGGIVVDALLGTGIRGAPRPPFDQVLEVLGAKKASGTPIVALDLPSGVDADTGGAEGDLPGADLTIAFGAPKLGCLLHPGRALSGRLVAVEIGFPPSSGEDSRASLVTPEWASRVRPVRALRSHKKSEGRLLLLGGKPGMAGALVMAGRAALRAGVGYLRIASHPANRDLLHATVPEAVLVGDLAGEALVEAAKDSDALAAGPGMGADGMTAALNRALESLPADGRVLLDADALTLLATGGLPAFDGTGGGISTRRLLTPHPGEAATLLERSAGDVVADPVAGALDGAHRWMTGFLLKGNPSVVASPDDARVRVSLTSSSEFSRAGMGDVLTGVAGALMARGLDGPTAGALALHWTGRAADHLDLGDALLPTDLEHGIPAAMAERGPGVTDLPFPFILLDVPAAR